LNSPSYLGILTQQVLHFYAATCFTSRPPFTLIWELSAYTVLWNSFKRIVKDFSPDE
jgi:hypothetical protein